MRSLNVRLVVILLTVGTVFVGGAIGLHAFQVRRNAHVYKETSDRAFERSKQAAKENNPQLEKRELLNAVQNLGWFLQFQPDDADAAEQFASLSAELAFRTGDTRDFERALGRLEAALRLAPDKKILRRQLIGMSIQSYRFQDAKRHIELLEPGIGNLKEIQPSPDRSDLSGLLKLYGHCQAGLGLYSDARKTLEKAIEFDPAQVDAYMLLAEVYRGRLSLPDAAANVMSKLVKTNPDLPKAHVLYGRYLKNTSSNDPASASAANEQALQAAKRALELAPDDPDALHLAAQCALVGGRFDEARKYAEHGIELNSADTTMYAILSDIELRGGNVEAALDQLQKGLDSTEQHLMLLEKKAHVHIDTRQLDSARRVVEDLKSVNCPKHVVELIEARIEFVQQNWMAARRSFEKLRGALPPSSALLRQVDTWIGECYGHMGEYDRQLEACRRALNGDPLFIPARVGVIEALRAAGRLDEAIAEYDQLDKARGFGPGAAIQYARLLISSLLRRPPAERNWAAVEVILDRAEKAMPDQVQIPIFRAEICVAKNDLPGAVQVLEKAAAENPKRPELLGALATLAERQEDWEKAERLLAEMREIQGDGVAQRLAQSQYLMLRFGLNPVDRPKAIEGLQSLAENCERFSDAECLHLWGVLLNFSGQLNDASLNKLLAGKMAEKASNNADIWYRLFEQARNEQDDAGMEKALDEIERIAGQSTSWLYGQAVRLTMHSGDNAEPERLADALKYLSKARSLRPSWQPIPLLEAKILDRQGDTGQALDRYQEAIRLGVRNPEVIQRTVQILFQRRQYDEADRLLRQLESQQTPLSPELNLAGAQTALYHREFDRSLEMARKAASQNARDFRSHLWLGQLLGSLGRGKRAEAQDHVEKASGANDPGAVAQAEKELAEAKELLAEAEKSLRAAAAIKPQVSDSWVALVQFLNAARMEDKVEAVIAEIAEKLPPEQALLIQAQCYDAIRLAPAALAKYEAALTAAPNDSSTVRLLADFYYRTGKITDAENLLQKIIDNEISAPDSDQILARRQVAVILFSRGGIENMRQGRELIEKNLAATKPAVEDRRLKAKLDASDPNPDRRGDAIRSLEALVREQLASVDDRFVLAQMYLADDSWMQANAHFRFLCVNYPEEPRFLTAYVAALLQHGEVYDAETYLNQLEKIAPKDFAAFSLRAELLVAQNKWDKALESLNRLWSEITPSPQALAQVCNRLLSYGKADPDSLVKLDAFLLTVLKQFNRPVPLLLTLADLRTLQGRYSTADGAEAFYREVLDKQPKNIAALNNLAVLLALQGVKLDEALSLVNRAVELAASAPAVLDSRASVYLALGELGKAAGDIDAALAIEETPVRLFHKARISEEAGQHNAAVTTMRKAMRTGKQGLTAKILHPLELPHYEKLRQLAR